MNWVDFFIGVVLIIAVSVGYKRGVFKELSTFLGLIAGTVVAFNYADIVAIKAEGFVNIAPSLRYVFSFVICFIATLLVFKLVGYYFYKMVKLSKLGFADKLGGGVFGALKGLAILSLLFLMFMFFPAFQSFNQAIDDSVMAPYIRQFIPFTYDYSSFLHPKSGKFIGKVSAGILGSEGAEYAKNPEKLMSKGEELGFSADDVRVLNNIDKYFGEQVEVAAKGADK